MCALRVSTQAFSRFGNSSIDELTFSTVRRPDLTAAFFYLQKLGCFGYYHKIIK